MAPIELLHLLGPSMTREELNRFFLVAENILVQPDPALELDAERRWMAEVYGKVRQESGLVIASIVDSLAKLSFYAEREVDPQGEAIKVGVDKLVRELLGNADQKRWLSLNGVFRGLAEASPDEFLNAVEASLNMSPPPICALLMESDDGLHFRGQCWHADLLWALELSAWSATRLSRVADILARLSLTPICRVPDDCIDPRRLALFAGRAFFRDLIITVEARQAGEFRP